MKKIGELRAEIEVIKRNEQELFGKIVGGGMIYSED